VAAIFSIAAASSTTRAASEAATRAGSNPAAYVLIALRSSDNVMRRTLKVGYDSYARPSAGGASAMGFMIVSR